MLDQHKHNLKCKRAALKSGACKSFRRCHNNFAHVLNFVIRPLRSAHRAGHVTFSWGFGAAVKRQC
ncbi:hypothetical protein Bra5_PD00232 (plasmid) [Rhizobium phaseoli Brasil 5]|nr:hypothetical protein Bra5_PD00232 [Rhizobium phaseoli Brasil 5]